MKRGELVTVALPGDFGKPRPAVVIQSDLYHDRPTVTLLPLTSDMRESSVVRLSVAPHPTNGLLTESQVMVDKIHTLTREKIGKSIGRLHDDQIAAINRALALFLGLV